MLASEPASWQRQEQSPEPDRSCGEDHSWLGLRGPDRKSSFRAILCQLIPSMGHPIRRAQPAPAMGSSVE
jgi:hypothetical protein